MLRQVFMLKYLLITRQYEDMEAVIEFMFIVKQLRRTFWFPYKWKWVKACLGSLLWRLHG